MLENESHPAFRRGGRRKTHPGGEGQSSVRKRTNLFFEAARTNPPGGNASPTSKKKTSLRQRKSFERWHGARCACLCPRANGSRTAPLGGRCPAGQRRQARQRVARVGDTRTPGRTCKQPIANSNTCKDGIAAPRSSVAQSDDVLPEDNGLACGLARACASCSTSTPTPRLRRCREYSFHSLRCTLCGAQCECQPPTPRPPGRRPLTKHGADAGKGRQRRAHDRLKTWRK